MKARNTLLVFLVMVALLAFGLSLPAHAAPPLQQVYLTNTPDPGNNNIYYIATPGDTCTRISLLYNITVEQLRQLNQLDANCTIVGGQKYLVGQGGVVAGPSQTPGPSPTPLPPTVTPTPFTGTTEICVLLFNDLNGDALRETGEDVIPGGAISVTEVTGKYSKTLNTAANPDPTAYQGTCFTDVPEGKYNIGVAIPDSYSPTMSLTYTLTVNAGDTAYVDFGAQSREPAVAQPSGGSTGGAGTSPFLGLIGGILLLGGLGLGWYALRQRTPQGRFKPNDWLRR